MLIVKSLVQKFAKQVFMGYKYKCLDSKVNFANVCEKEKFKFEGLKLR